MNISTVIVHSWQDIDSLRELHCSQESPLHYCSLDLKTAVQRFGERISVLQVLAGHVRTDVPMVNTHPLISRFLRLLAAIDRVIRSVSRVAVTTNISQQAQRITGQCRTELPGNNFELFGPRSSIG